MVYRYYLRTSLLKEGMKLGQALTDRLDRVCVAKGTVLDAHLIQALKRMHIDGVYIEEEAKDAIAAEAEEKLPPFIKDTIEKNKVKDPAKVELSESVKKRVSEGVQYLYNNSGSEQFAETSNRITQDLVRAIDENDALAVDISTLKTSDEYTFKHSVDVATISMIIARKQGFSEKDIYDIGISGLLHDMGKSKIPLEILNKPDRLNDAEFEVMKQHSVLGYKILKEKKEFSDEVALAVLQHHEKMNGTGYPFGHTKEKIIPYAKILSISDVYDALVTERPYKKACSQRNAVEIIMSMTPELDITAMRSFMESVILYPVGTNVELSNGEMAKVVRNNTGLVLRPVVVGLTSGKVYDLANDFSCANVIIL